jgi:hypothetical protein
VEGKRWGFGALNGLGGPIGGHILAFEGIKVAQSIEHFRLLPVLMLRLVMRFRK